jgi:PHP family Zn ribbon phosphoesterase
MSPAALAARASELGLDVIAITDHNSALNCRAFDKCCKDLGILPVFGIEVTSIEEAHVICLFETADQAEELGRLIYDKLPPILNKPEKFGDQVYVDSEDNILGEVEKYLVSAAEISLDELCALVHKLEGLYIPAHIDKPLFSIPSQLGFLPQMDYDALETTVIPCPVDTGSYPIIQNSDAHYLGDIGKRCCVYEAQSRDFSSISRAIMQKKITPA